jgi:hypothetical protein
LTTIQVMPAASTTMQTEKTTNPMSPRSVSTTDLE